MKNHIELKSKQTSLSYTTLTGITIIALLLLPWLTAKQSETEVLETGLFIELYDPMIETNIEVVNTSEDLSSSEGAKTESSANTNDAAQSEEDKFIETEVVKQTPTADPVVVDNTSKEIPLPSSDNVEHSKGTSTIPDVPVVTTETSGSNGGSTTTNQEGSGTGNGSGTGGQGEEGDGEGEHDNSGNGVFGRKVIYRAPVAQIAEKDGTVTIDICINRSGDVVTTEYNAAKSTLSDEKFINNAKIFAAKYKFEDDQKAAKKQCGKLTFKFIVKIKKP